MTDQELIEMEASNPEHEGGKWCQQCGRAYPFPGHMEDCPLFGFQSGLVEDLNSLPNWTDPPERKSRKKIEELEIPVIEEVQ
jgi:hypothetical protein